MRVLLGARDPVKGEEAARGLVQAGLDVEPVALDVTDAASIRALQGRLAAVDVLVNNTGVDYDTDQTALSADLARVRRILDTNLFGAWAMAQAVAPGMRRWRWARIVNVSSGAGSLATMDRGTPGYSASKAVLNALTRLMAAELAGTGVLVNSVCPGWPGLGRNRHGRPRRAPGDRWRQKCGLGRDAQRQRADRWLLPRRPAGRVVSSPSSARR